MTKTQDADIESGETEGPVKVIKSLVSPSFDSDDIGKAKSFPPSGEAEPSSIVSPGLTTPVASARKEDDDIMIERVPVGKAESNLNTHADPFAPRDGKTLVWKDINMTLVRL